MLKFFEKLLGFIFSTKCYLCHSEDENNILCSKCFSSLKYNKIQPFYNKENNILFYSAGVYKDDLRNIIKGLKFHNQKNLAKHVAKYMYTYWQNLNLPNKNYKVIAVPQYHKTRKPYNHAQEIAIEFAKLTNYKYDFELIKRIKKTRPQYKLTKQEREENLKDAFVLTKPIEKDVTYIIIDDIITTSSTVYQMKKTMNVDDVIIYCASMTEAYLK